MALISRSLDEWRVGLHHSGPPYHVEIVGPWKLPQVCDRHGVAALSGPEGAVFCGTLKQAEYLCELANDGKIPERRRDWWEEKRNEMRLYKKKPVIVEALQYAFDGEKITPEMSQQAIAEFMGQRVSVLGDKIVIPTLEGEMYASPGDWIIKGTKGEFYPCKPDIFTETYEAA